MDPQEEIDLTLAIQLQAQFAEELRVQSLQQDQVLLLSQGSSEISGKTPLPGPSQKRRKGQELDEPPQEKLSVSLIDPSWEMIDPNPDLHTLFLTFDNQFFWGRLYQVEVKWSPRMTLCAGVCSYEGRGGLCSIRLSTPLLKLRPRKDMIETLLHEMIHAYLFVTANNKDRDGHGPEFHKHMYRINGVAGTKISVYHSFHDEVDQYRQHIWQCDGPCRHRRPYYGLVKRSMNRAPAPRDPWWGQHQQTCGGTYHKIQEPEGYGQKKGKGASAGQKKGNNGADIRKLFGGTSKGSAISGSKTSSFNTGSTSPPSKENMPGYRNTKAAAGSGGSGGSAGFNNFNATGGAATKSNVHGLGSTATGTMKRVDVSNASRSNVHGFSGGSSPAKKKPRTTGGMGSPEGSGSSFKKPPGSFGSGTALKGRGGGSKTVTVKGKAATRTESEGDTSSEVRSPPRTLFEGSGHTLGGPSSGVSRLLSLSAPQSTSSSSQPRSSSSQPGSSSSQSRSSSSQSRSSSSQSSSSSQPSIKRKEWLGNSPQKDKGKSRSPDKGKLPQKGKSASPSSRKIDSFFKSSSPKDPEEQTPPGVNCPICNKVIPKRLINKHLDECIGDLGDDDDFECEPKSIKRDKTAKDSVKQESIHNSSSQSRGDRTISVSSDDDDDCFLDGTKRLSPNCVEIVGDGASASKTYPCPVCSEQFPESQMNQHLDSHF